MVCVSRYRYVEAAAMQKVASRQNLVAPNLAKGPEEVEVCGSMAVG
jgi:hypothetical protein